LANGRTRQATSRLVLRYWLPVLAYVSVIFFLSAQPNLKPPLHFLNSDKLMHAAEYGGFGVLMARAVRATLPQHAFLATSLLTLAIGMAIGVGDERFQTLIPGRECSLFDWLADSTGLVFAQILYVTFAKDGTG